MKKLFGRFFLLPYFILMLILSLGCGSSVINKSPVPTPTLIDPDIFSSNCTSGCWKQIMVGQTTEEQLEKYLRSNAFLHDRVNSSTNSTNTVYTTNYIYIGNSVTAIVKEGIVSEIILNGFFDFNLKEMISRLGMPDISSLHYDRSTGHITGATVEFYYLQDGYIFSYIAQKNKNQTICFEENTYITNIVIFNENSNIELPTSSSGSLINTFNNWPGYDCIVVPKN